MVEVVSQVEFREPEGNYEGGVGGGEVIRAKKSELEVGSIQC